MKILRALLLASAVGMSSDIPALAQQAAAPSQEAIDEAKKLVAIMSPDMIKDMNGKMLAQLWPAMEQALQPVSSKLDAAATAEMNAEVRAEFERLMTAQLTELMDAIPAVYARYLTVDEMREIVAFYRTPTGAKVVKVMPEIMGETMQNFAPHVQEAMQRLQVALDGILQKYSHGLK
jgi:uncharacterized protein